MNNKAPSVLIVILNWNNVELLIDCLGAVFQSDYPNFKVLVIDNNSDLDPQDRLLQDFPEIIYHRSLVNLGFAGGVNYGMEYAVQNGFDYIWAVNNDALVETNCLSKLINRMSSEHSIGLASPIILNNSLEKRLIYCGGLIDLEKGKRFLAKDLDEIQQWMLFQPEKICLNGTALLIRMELVKKIGFLDKAFFAYHEDIDYSVRASKAGYRNVIISDAIIFHESRIIKFEQIPQHYYYYMARNELRLWRKHYLNQKGLIRKYVVWGIKKVVGFGQNHEEHAAVATIDGVWNALFGNELSYNQRRNTPKFLQKSLVSHPEKWQKLIRFLQVK